MAKKQGRPRSPENIQTGQEQAKEAPSKVIEQEEKKRIVDEEVKKEIQQLKDVEEKEAKEKELFRVEFEAEIRAKIETEQAEKTKVIEVTTKTAEKSAKPEKIRPSQRNRGMHEVIVKGKSRQMTKLSYEALVKDPKLEVTLPKGSLLVEPVITPCKDC